MIFELLVGYVSGSLPFGIWIPKFFGKGDPRTIGSGNIGTSNVYRLAGLKIAMLVYMADFLKGFIPVFWAQNNGISTLWVGLGCVLGHMFSFILKGKGGKGVATAAGVLTPLMPLGVLSGICVWVGGVFFTRYAFLGTLLACLWIVSWSLWYAPEVTPLVITLVGFVLIRHVSNFKRFFKRKEVPCQHRSPRS